MPAESTRASLRQIRLAVDTAAHLVALSGAATREAVTLVCDRQSIRSARDRLIVMRAVARKLARTSKGAPR
jgi:hypothetical protein